MKVKEFLSTLFIWASLIVGEIHTLFENMTLKANWILTKSVVMPVQWNVKFAGEELQGILYALAFIFWEKTRINKTTAWAFLIYYVVDCIFYFYNYKQREGGYAVIYLIILISWILIYNNYGRKCTTDGSGIAAKIKWGN
jgi:uncharacterized membrane protein YozB (DUF420 family)